MFQKSIESSYLPEDYQSTLSYYKDKVDALYQERIAWLSKLDECTAQLKYKQEKQQKLKKIKNDIDDTNKSIIHLSAAYFDEMINSIALQRNNTGLQYEDAQQILKLKQLSQEYPKVVPKQISWSGVCIGEEIIKNDLNLFNNVKPKAGKQKKISLKEEKRKKEEQAIQNKPPTATLEGLLTRQISDMKSFNQKERKIMESQISDLQDKIRIIKKEEKKKLQNERQVIKEFQNKFKKLEQKHKQLAEEYFDRKRTMKKKYQNSKKQHQELQKTFISLEEKTAEELRVYQKQNKAKQTLILRKSGDFQEDYKARMRAKERNLQALKNNYQKMQQICIVKVRKLEATVEKAKSLLKETEKARQFTIIQLREDLRILQKKDVEQARYKIKLDQKIKNRIEEEKLQKEAQRQKMQKTKRLQERDKKIVTAYKKTKKNSKKSKQKGKRKADFDHEESRDDENSLDMSDIDKIRQEINDLEKKITQEDKHYE